MSVCWNDFITQIQNSRRILISSHARADGDALGSALALAVALRVAGWEATVLMPDTPPAMFRFMGKNYDEIRIYNSQDMTFAEAQTYDTLVVVDTSARMQLQSVCELVDAGMKTLVIDHHAVADKLTAHNFSDANQPAAGCLVMSLIEALGVPLGTHEEGATCSIADFLFFAIATDTGWFRFPLVLPDTMIQAGRLMEAGASTARLYRVACENYSPARMKLLGTVALNSVLTENGLVAYSWIRRSDFERFNASLSDTADLVNALMTTASVSVAILFTETPGGIRLNLRSCDEYNVAEIAHKFGGGGHKNAAGATIQATLEEAIEAVKDVCSF